MLSEPLAGAGRSVCLQPPVRQAGQSAATAPSPREPVEELELWGFLREGVQDANPAALAHLSSELAGRSFGDVGRGREGVEAHGVFEPLTLALESWLGC